MPGCARRRGTDKAARPGACAVPRALRAGRPGGSRRRPAGCAFPLPAWPPPPHGRDLTFETIGRDDEHFDGDRNVYRGVWFLRSPCSDVSMPKVSWKPRRPTGVTITAWLRFILSSQPRSKYRVVIAAPTAPAMCGRRSVQTRQSREKRRRVEPRGGNPERESGEKTGAAGRISVDLSD